MLAKSPTKIAIRPTALVLVMTRMWRVIDPVTNRGGGASRVRAAQPAGSGGSTDMRRLSALRVRVGNSQSL